MAYENFLSENQMALCTNLFYINTLLYKSNPQPEDFDKAIFFLEGLKNQLFPCENKGVIVRQDSAIINV